MKNEWQLDKEELSGVREWLKASSTNRKNKCPFFEITRKRFKDAYSLGDTRHFDHACKPICTKLFKKLGIVEIEDYNGKVLEYSECPCCVYVKPGYVVRVARLLLARKGLFGRGYAKSKRDKKRAAAQNETATKV